MNYSANCFKVLRGVSGSYSAQSNSNVSMLLRKPSTSASQWVTGFLLNFNECRLYSVCSPYEYSSDLSLFLDRSKVYNARSFSPSNLYTFEILLLEAESTTSAVRQLTEGGSDSISLLSRSKKRSLSAAWKARWRGSKVSLESRTLTQTSPPLVVLVSVLRGLEVE